MFGSDFRESMESGDAYVGSLGTISKLRDEIKILKRQKDLAYKERSLMVVLYASLCRNLGHDVFRSEHLGKDWDDGWRNILYIESSAGQMSWHFHDLDTWMLRQFGYGKTRWDSHTFSDKYKTAWQNSGLGYDERAYREIDKLEKKWRY